MSLPRKDKASNAKSRALEDYLEQIHNLIELKGYARVVDIASNLKVSQASVTNMIQKLDAEGYVLYERYRGVTLTPEGLAIGKAIAKRHEILSRLLTGFGIDSETVHHDVEGMEHHISKSTLQVLTLLLEELEANPELLLKLKARMS